MTDQQMGVVYDGMRWSPDGGHLYYSYNDPDQGDLHNGIWVVGADGAGTRHLTGGTVDAGGAPSVVGISARDDLLLALYPMREVQSPVKGPILALVDTSSGSSRPVAPGATAIAPHEYAQQAAFSPDGSALLMATSPPDPNHQVLVGATAGGAPVSIVPDGLRVAAPSDLTVMPTWASNGTVFIPGGAGLSTGTLLSLPSAAVLRTASSSPGPSAVVNVPALPASPTP